ncbi:MAG: cytochrome c [Deltaproteobacteria bacterium]|nr:MAG: cytochrome c [Deltaproteobacteria bacterium]
MEELFAEKCGSCHSIGKGARVGPDLKGAHERHSPEWLHQFIKAPSSKLDSDPDARALLKKYNNVRMPDLGLSDEQVDGLIALIERCSAQPCNLAGAFRPVTEATPEDVALGRALFTGEQPLSAGGPPCISCHTARGIDTPFGGGTLAVDLTHVFAKLGDEGLDSALKSPAFPLMKDIFADKKLTKEEAFAIRAFLSAANRSEQDEGDTFGLLLAGLLGAALCLVVLNALWSRRLRGIRKPLIQSSGVVS